VNAGSKLEARDRCREHVCSLSAHR
jgi:hypothetical protein